MSKKKKPQEFHPGDPHGEYPAPPPPPPPPPPHEKPHTEKKKRRKRVPILLILLVLLIAAIIFLTNGFGLGGSGSKNGSSGSGGDSSAAVSAPADSEASSQAQPESSEASSEVSNGASEQLTYIDVTVSENDYIYKNNKLPLDELIEKLKSDAVGIQIKITDDNASHKAYTSLIKALEENNIHYIDSEA